MLYSLVRNDEIIISPRNLYKYSWTDPDTKKGYSGLWNLSEEQLDILGWKKAEYTQPSYDFKFEKLIESNWFYDSVLNIVTKTITVEELSFEESLTKVSTILESNREKHEISGFLYDKQIMGLDVIILTDKESSQGKLNSSYTMAKEGTRTDNDVWKFENIYKQTLILPLSNIDLISICEFIYRKIQDDYNLTSQIFFQMLACESTSVLKQEIVNGNILLDPWNSVV